jgi:hypothetical protein
MERVFKSKLSKWIIGFYWFLFIVIVALTVFPILLSLRQSALLMFMLLMSPVLLLFIYIILKAYNIKFTITGKNIIIDGVFCKKTVKISDIKSIQKTFIPVGFKIYGASFLGGWHYFPAIGTAWVVMGNFEDGVLITTKQKKHYLITPVNPLEFIKILKKKGKRY